MTTSATAIGPEPSERLPLAKFLKRYPWQKESRRRSMDYLWHFDLETPVERLWPHLSDTSALNRAIGLPSMSLEEQAGEVYGRANHLGWVQEWLELPWEWQEGLELASTRVYSKGFARRVRARYLLATLPGGGTRVSVYFGWIPRRIRGRVLIPIAMRWLRRRYSDVLSELDTALIENRQPFAVPASSLQPTARIRLDSLEKTMIAERAPSDLLVRIRQFIEEGTGEELHRIRPRQLARRWGVAMPELLNTLLRGTRHGLFLLVWDIVCPHCRGPQSGTGSLGELPSGSRCDPCDLDFEITGIEGVEVSFRVHPSIRETHHQVHCSAEPARKPHIVIQRRLSAGERTDGTTSLVAGRYRLRVRGVQRYGLVDVVGETDANDTIRCNSDDILRSQRVTPAAKISLENPSTDANTFVLERHGSDTDALRPADLFAHQTFRDVCPHEALPPDLQLDVGRQCIMFTDIVGSSRFYIRAGDALAFAQVRAHFVRVQSIVANFGGAVVKTIGDASMVVFTESGEALAAAMEIQRQFDGDSRPGEEERGQRLRVSLHAGPCVAVNLNTGIDYFGSTVNAAAKLQSITRAGEITFTEQVVQDPKGQAFVAEHESAIQRIPDTLIAGKKASALRLKIS